jgi:hypothetical protein
VLAEIVPRDVPAEPAATTILLSRGVVEAGEEYVEILQLVIAVLEEFVPSTI